MPYGIIKVDQVTFTNAGVDQTISVSGIVASISGNITATGTISGNVIRGGTTVSGATVTGTAGQFGTITGNTAGFTTVTGTTVTGTTANFVTVSGTTVTGTTAQFTTVTGGTAGFTTVTGTTVTGTTANFVTVSGTTVTGNVGNFTTVTGGSAGFTTVTGTTITGTTLTVASGTFTGNSTAAAFIPTGSTVPTNGVYLPSANNVAISTGGSGRLFVDASGRVGINSAPSLWLLEVKQDSASSAGGAYPVIQVNNPNANGYAGVYLNDSTAQAGLETQRNTGHLGLQAGGSERLRITSAGLVGVGTSSPSHALTVNGAISSLTGVIRAEQGANAGFVIGSRSAQTDFQLYNTGNVLRFYNGSLDALSIDTSGRVGIGTSSPAGKTEIASSGSESTLILRNTSGALSTYSELKFAPFTGTTAAAASIRADYYQNDTSTLAFRTTNTNAEPTTRLFIDGTGRVGIGTTSPTSKLHVSESFSSSSIPLRVYGSATGTGGALYDVAHFLNDDATTVRISEYNTGTSSITGELTLSAGDGNTQVIGSTGPLVFKTNVANGTVGYLTTNERARIDSSGRLLVGTSSAPVGGGVATFARLQIEGNSFGSTGPGSIALRMGTAPTSIVAGNEIGQIAFAANNNGEFARIECYADATAGNNDYPGRLVFSTTADGASSPTERMRITNGGTVLIGKTADNNNAGFKADVNSTYMVADAQTPVFVNRNTNDGTLIEFRQDGTGEGTISVSGTTVSYNGAHLSRWSQLPGGAERTEILRGSVLSNIDEMCEWGDEENEQLNRMKVSDVEGDKNVSGVFQAWDDDDDTYTNDFYCAMTGDFIIRIGAGITVERGDLLMSAGDGTAKPQDDDIIRSKTIAKVTSTNVSCTYEDGSYCVPCVLMAC